MSSVAVGFSQLTLFRRVAGERLRVSRTPGVVGPLDSAGLPSRRCQLLASLATDVVRCRWLFIVDTFSSRRRRTTSGVQERSVLVELRLKSAERNSKCLSTQAVPSWFHSCFRQLKTCVFDLKIVICGDARSPVSVALIFASSRSAAALPLY